MARVSIRQIVWFSYIAAFFIPAIVLAAAAPLHIRDPLRQGQGLNVEPFTGSFTKALPIEVPPGRNGIQPDLELRYDSSAGQIDDIFGFGWSVNIPYIQRLNKKGVERLYVSSSTPFFYSSLDGELATTSASTTVSYGPEVENGAFRQYTYSTSTGWTVTAKDGKTFKFGYSTTTRQDNSSATTSVYKWMLEEVRDANGNYITYEYFKHRGQIYPYKMTYTHNSTSTGVFEVEFLRETRADVSTSTATGFNVVTDYRIYEIQAKINGSWVRKYALGYTTGHNGTRSLLASSTESGKDEQGNITTLPATVFSYQSTLEDWSQTATWNPPDYFTSNTDDKGLRIADINGDGLMDFVRKDSSAPANTMTYLNNTGGLGGFRDSAGTAIPQAFSNGGTSDVGVRLVEVNGDGLVDVLYGLEGSSRAVYINDGGTSGWTASTSWTQPLDFTNGTSDFGVRFGDVNGDAMIDLVQAFGGSPTSNKVYINNGNGTGWTLDTNYSVPDYFTSGTDDSGLRLEDINGDGLADLIRDYCGSPTVDDVYINKGDGTGWTEYANWTIPECFSNGSADQGSRLADVNGDGLVDLIKRDNSDHRVNINNGSGWTHDTGWSLPYAFTNGSVDQGIRIADIDGDGLVDMIKANSSEPGGQISLHNGTPVDLLSTITDSSGGKTSIIYKGTGEYLVAGTNTPLNPDLPFTLQTAHKVVRNDGYGNISTTTYNYYGGDLYYRDQVEKKRAGFERVDVTDPDGNVTRMFYHQGNVSSTTRGEYEDHISKLGKPWRAETYDSGGNLIAKTITRWDRVQLSGNDRHFVKLHQSVDFAYDGDSDHRELATSYTYNATGSIIGRVEWGEVSGSEDGTFTDTGTNLASTSLSYVASTTGYLMLPAREVTTDYNGAKVRETDYYYDGNNATTSAPTRGNLTKEERWKSGTSFINTLKSYTPFGLVAKEQDPRGATTTYKLDAYELYAATSTNALGHITHHYYDYSLGKPATTTDPNGRNFVTVYDGLDRVIAVKEPDQNSPSTLVTKTGYTYTDSGSRKIKETQYLTSATSTDLYRYVNGFDQIIQERKESEDANTYAVRDYTYDKRGLRLRESIPYFSTGSATTTATTSNSAFTSYYYDALQRMTSMANTLGTTTYSYDDWRASTTDPLSHVKMIEKDAFGNIVRVNEVNATATYATLYEYNRNNNLTKITDALGNARNFTYDGLGRRLTAEDLHASGDSTYGTWTFTFDDAGNLSSQLDPKSQTVNFTYDALNRILTENYTGEAGTEIVYIYDNCTDGTGRLCSASTTAATTSFTYTPNGLKKTETQQVGTTTATTIFAYDQQDNITDITYPDGASTHYTYNDAGLAETISHRERGAAATTTLVEDIDYGPHGKATYQNFFNGRISTTTYNMNGLWRLLNKTTGYDSEVLGIFLTTALIDFLPSGDFWRWPLFAYADAEELLDQPVVADGEMGEALGSSTVVTEEPVVEAVDPGVPPSPGTVPPAVTDNITEALPTDPPVSVADTATSTSAEDQMLPPADAAESAAGGATSTPTGDQSLPLEEMTSPETLAVSEEGSPALDATVESEILVPLELTPEEPVITPTSTPEVLATQTDGLDDRPGRQRPELLSWNVLDARESASGEVRSILKGKWVRYLDADNAFKLIDTALASTSEGWCTEKAPLKACIPFRSTGTVTIEDRNRFDISTKSAFDAAPVTKTIRALDVADVPGELLRGTIDTAEDAEYVIYRDAYPSFGADLVYWVHNEAEPTVKELVVFNDAGRIATDTILLPFEETLSEDMDIELGATVWDKNTEVETRERTVFKQRSDPRRGFEMRKPQAWFYTSEGPITKRVAQSINLRFTPVENTKFIKTKVLRHSLFEGATGPIYTDTITTINPNPNPESTSVDGYSNYGPGSTDWAEVRDSGSGNDTSDSAITASLYTGKNNTGKIEITRAFLLFDTSSIPAENTISSSSIRFYCSSVNNGDNDGDDFFAIIKTGPGASTSLAHADYDAIDNTSGAIPHAGGDFKEYSNRVDISNMVAGQYQSFTLTAAATATIEIGGVVGFGAAEGHDVLNNAYDGPNNSNNLCAIHFAEASNDPELIVDHIAPPPSPPPPPPPPPSFPAGGIQNVTYEYDAVGNITKTTDYSNSSTSKIVYYGYDDLYRLTSASTTYASTSPDYKHTFGYSALGNIATSSAQGTYSYDGSGSTYVNPHGATTIGTSTLTNLYYDANGNLASTTRGPTTWRYGWDFKNQLTQAASGTATTTFAYDHSGSRVALRSTGAATTTYANRLFNVVNGTTTKHIFVGGELVATMVGNGNSTSSYIVHTDHLGGTGVVTNASGTAVQTLDYYPFGDMRVNSGSVSEQRRFTGHEYDQSTDLSYMGARYQNGSRGTFLSQDPVAAATPERFLGDPQQFNSYSYSRNNPIIYIDPNGLFTVAVPGTNYNEADWSEGGAASAFLSSVGETFGETPVVAHWSGNDNPRARQSAANNIIGMINEHQFAEGEQLNIVGHSHGGNIAAIVSQMTDRRIDNLVTLGTPVNSAYQLNYNNIGQHVNAYSNLDMVQRLGGTQMSASQVIGQALFGNVGGWLGGKMSLGQFGLAGRTFSGAENVNVTGSTLSPMPMRLHSNYWIKPSVWNAVNNHLQ